MLSWAYKPFHKILAQQVISCRSSDFVNQELDVSRFTSVGAAANSDRRLSSTIGVETPLVHTPADDSEVIAAQASSDDRTQSDKTLPFDTEALIPRFNRSEHTNSIQLAQPLYVFSGYLLLRVDLCVLGWMSQRQRLNVLSAGSYTYIMTSVFGLFSWLVVLVCGDGITHDELPKTNDRPVFF